MKNTKRKLIVVSLIMAFAVFNVLGFSVNDVKAETEAEKTQNQIDDLEKKKAAAEKELQAAQSQYWKNQTQINAAQNLVNKLSSDIAIKEKELANLSVRMEFNKKMLAEYMRQLYYLGQEDSLFQLSLWQEGYENSFSGADSMLNVKNKILDVLREIAEAKGQTLEEQAKLTERKQDNQEVLQDKKAEQGEVLADVQEKKFTLAEIQQKISKLRSTLSSFLGESFNADDIVDAIKFASKKTGVRKEFLMAMLDKESDLGRFTGGCTYQNTRVKNSDKEVFKDICEELDYNYKKQKISCAASWGGYGGAMGVAQFMPTTWTGYKNAISEYTGHNPPDPWNLTDGVVGMAEKLKRAGASSKSKEHYAAKVYYCGGPSSAYWKTKCEDYADTVISWSKGYDEYF